jgi:hypothetical protein
MSIIYWLPDVGLEETVKPKSPGGFWLVGEFVPLSIHPTAQ